MVLLALLPGAGESLPRRHCKFEEYDVSRRSAPPSGVTEGWWMGDFGLEVEHFIEVTSL